MLIVTACVCSRPPGSCGGSAGGGKQLSVDGGFHDRFGLLAALATLGSHAQLAAYFSESGSTFGDGFPDLAIGYGFAEAHVHGGGPKLICCEH